MSTYSSDFGLSLDLEGFYDVAHDCFGRDVRICLGGRSTYLSVGDARNLAQSINGAADRAEAMAAEVDR